MVDKKSDAKHEHEVHEFGGEVSETKRPVPWLIWLLWPAYFLWAASYVLFNGLMGCEVQAGRGAR